MLESVDLEFKSQYFELTLKSVNKFKYNIYNSIIRLNIGTPNDRKVYTDFVIYLFY